MTYDEMCADELDLPVKMYAGFSRCREPVSIAIRYLTRDGNNPFRGWSPWSHMFLVFEYRSGRRVIHEALLSEGWASKDFEKLIAWRAKGGGRMADLLPLPIPAQVVSGIYRRSQSWVGQRKSYATRQIIDLAKRYSMVGRYALRRFVLAPMPDTVICSEGACQLVGEAWPPLDIRDWSGEPWDNITPQMAWERLKSRIDKQAIEKNRM